METRSCFARFLLILVIARCHHQSAVTHATNSISLSPSSATASASSTSSSSSSSPPSAASLSCQTNNASIRTLFRCRPDIFQSRTVCIGEKWTLRCPNKATFISILSAQLSTAGNVIPGQERCFNMTYKPKGTNCAGQCVTPLFEQKCQGKRRCSSKDLPDQRPVVASDFAPCGSPGTGLEDHPFNVTYTCVSKGFLSQSVSSNDPDQSNACLQRSRGVVENEEDDDDDDGAVEGLPQSPSGRQLATPVPEADDESSRSEVPEPRLPRRPTNEPLEVIVEVTQIHLDNRRSTSQHRGNVQGRNATDDGGTARPLQTIAHFTTTTVGGRGGGSSDGLGAGRTGGGFAGWYGNVSEWIWTWKYIQERRENFFLYMTLALLFGVMTVLIVLILRLTHHNRKSRRQHRLHGRRPKSESAPLTTSRGSPVAWRTPESDRSLPGEENVGRTPRPPVELTSFNRVGSLPGLDCGTPPPPMPPPPPLVDSPGEFRGSNEDFQVEHRVEFPVVEFPSDHRRGEYRADGGGEQAQAKKEQQRTELRRDLPKELRRGYSHEFLGEVCNDFKQELRGGELFPDTRRDFSRDTRRDFHKDDLRGDFPRGDFPRDIIRGDFQKELCGDYSRTLRGDFQKELRGDYPGNLRGDFQKDTRGDFTREFRGHAVPGHGIASVRDPSHQRPMTATINRSLCGQLNSTSGLRFGRTSFMDTAPIPSSSVLTPSFTLPGERLFPARRHHSLAGLDFRGTDEDEFMGRRSLQQSPCGRDYLIEMELMECLKTLQPVIRQYNREAGFATS